MLHTKEALKKIRCPLCEAGHKPTKRFIMAKKLFKISQMDQMVQLQYAVSNGHLKKAQQLIDEMLAKFKDKPDDAKVAGFTAGFFRHYLRLFGYQGSISESLARPLEEKVEIYLREMNVGEQISYTTLAMQLQEGLDQEDEVQKNCVRIARRLKKEGRKFGIGQDNLWRKE